MSNVILKAIHWTILYQLNPSLCVCCYFFQVNCDMQTTPTTRMTRWLERRCVEQLCYLFSSNFKYVHDESALWSIESNVFSLLMIFWKQAFMQNYFAFQFLVFLHGDYLVILGIKLNGTIIIIIIRHAPCQCVAPLATNSFHSGLFKASKVRLCRDRSLFKVAIQEV